MKKIFINLLLTLASFVVALCAGEVVARIYLAYQDRMVRQKSSENILTQVAKKELFEPVQPGSYTNRANALMHWWGLDIRMDSLGCRTGLPAPDSARVILFLGDSMIFGLGLPDSATIPALLQSRLNSPIPDRPSRVINAGVIGYDFQQYLYRLKELAPDIRPALILVGLCYNDLLPNEDPFGDVMAERQGKPEKSAIPGEATAQMPHRSTLGQVKAYLHNSAIYTLWSQSGISSKSAKQRVTEYDPAKKASLERAPALVGEFLETARELNVPPAFVYFPVFPGLHQDSDLIYVQLLREKGLPVMDLSHSAELNKDSYFFRESKGHLLPDIHFNLKGSQEVAIEISRWLIAQGLWGRARVGS